MSAFVYGKVWRRWTRSNEEGVVRARATSVLLEKGCARDLVSVYEVLDE